MREETTNNDGIVMTVAADMKTPYISDTTTKPAAANNTCVAVSKITPAVISAIDDYIVMAFMLGNDFMPHFPSLNLRTNGMTVLLQTYANMLKNNKDGLLVSRSSGRPTIIWKNMRTFIGLLAETEHNRFMNEHKTRDRQSKMKYGGGGGGSGSGGVFEKNGMTIFTDNLPRLIHLYSGSQSLADLHFTVHVGTVVWNQCKTILSDDSSKTRLIYSLNIENAAFVHKTYKNTEKKAFIDKPGIQEPMLVLNRGYGVGNYQFDYCFITPDIVGSSTYLVENHLICITTAAATAADEDIAERFHRIIQSFRDPRTREFIECYFGNSAINTTELNHMLPIYNYDI